MLELAVTCIERQPDSAAATAVKKNLEVKALSPSCLHGFKVPTCLKYWTEMLQEGIQLSSAKCCQNGGALYQLER